MTQPHYTRDDLYQTMRDCIIRQEWESDFAPPEGVEGRGGADPTTELKGFKKDAESMIVTPMLEKFPQGGSATQIADALTDLAYSQRNASAGAFARFMTLNIRDRVAPGYLDAKAAATLPKATPDALMAHLDGAATSSDATQIMDNLKARLVNKSIVTTDTIVEQLKQIGDEYDRMGDDFLAEEADLLRSAANDRLANDAQPEAVKAIVSQWKAEERNWQNPLQDKLGNKPLAQPTIKAQANRPG